ncbi:hypothetical protein [Sphingomonas xinjiangensis]|uniref:Uncharacterized protein n=1 Tax=Sphingomonas xinjiangensis TaxID=643568 RepID=A0A840YU30_9SPHN|nr:hypothetical protein [Sphingomonas xinjiangensis]MBB5713152.1 hypothetical protein [Sphingomonas xinjiangensis]
MAFMFDRWTDAFFWPALIGAWTGALVAIAAVLLGNPFPAMIGPTTIILAALSLAMFVLMLADAQTRRAVKNYNLHAGERSREMTWRERLFSKEYGDRRIVIINRFAWLAAVVFVFAQRQDLALLCITSFFISTLMAMLMLKRRSWNVR